MINAFCFYYGEDSWSRHARAFFTAWSRRESVAITSWNTPDNGQVQEFLSPSPNVPSIGLGPIELMPTVTGSPRIAYIVWETTLMPRDKVAILAGMDALWVPSHWGRQILIDNGLPAARISVVPEGGDILRFRPIERPRTAGQPFRFLFVGKWEERKCVDLLIDCFVQEFGADEPVELVLHATNPYISGFNLAARIARAVRGRVCAPIIPSVPLSEDAMITLYSDCDAFVLPTRAEGWGLPITEAMACGLPVIVTDYSAPTDFLAPDHAYLLPVEKMVAVRDRDFFPAGQRYGRWAQPDATALRGLMRHVVDHPNEARIKGMRARTEIERRWTWDHAVDAAQRAVKAIA